MVTISKILLNYFSIPNGNQIPFEGVALATCKLIYTSCKEKVQSVNIPMKTSTYKRRRHPYGNLNQNAGRNLFINRNNARNVITIYGEIIIAPVGIKSKTKRSKEELVE